MMKRDRFHIGRPFGLPRREIPPVAVGMMKGLSSMSSRRPPSRRQSYDPGQEPPDPAYPPYSQFRGEPDRSPPEQKSFVQERGREIIAGVMVAVLAAAIIGGVTAFLTGDDDNGPTPTPELPDTIQSALGNWDFVRYEGNPPAQPIPGMCVQPGTLNLLANRNFLGTINHCDTGAQFLSASGFFSALDEDTIEVRGEAESPITGVHDLEVHGDELWMTDQSTGTTVVYQRR